jgi:hypothetical protein
MFFGFVPFCQGLWWNYTESDFLTKFNNSWNMPIYALCYGKNCPHCQGLPQRFEMFASAFGLRDDVLCTAIDINNTSGCRHLGAYHIPYWVFVRGTNKKYWLYPSFNCPLRWMDFVSDWVDPIAKNMPIDEFEATLNSTFNGGSAFYLELPDTEKEPLKLYQTLSARYHVVNNSFAYSFRKDRKLKLTIYKSPHCLIQFDELKLDFSALIEQYKFSHFHHYDSKEWRQLSSQNKTVLVMIDSEINENTQNLLYGLSRDYCASHEMGWGRVDQQKSIGKVLERSEVESPFVVVTDPFSKCRYVHDSVDLEIEPVRKLIEAPDSHQCLKFEVSTPEEKEAVKQEQSGEGLNVVQSDIPGKVFLSALHVGIGLAIIAVVAGFLIKFRRRQQKLE